LFFSLVILLLLGLAGWFGAESVRDFFKTDHPCVALKQQDNSGIVVARPDLPARHQNCKNRLNSDNPNSYALRTTELISGVVLVIILLEIAETVYEQVIRHKRRLTKALVVDFLVIGVVASVRHLLASGARLSVVEATTEPTV